MMLSHRGSMPKSYRFVARITGRALPHVDKELRLRCTLSAEDHSIVGVSVVVVALGTADDCDHRIELIHEPPAHNAPPPRYFELVASLVPIAAPGTRLRGAFALSASSDGTDYRVAGMMDPAQGRVVLPEIALRGA